MSDIGGRISTILENAVPSFTSKEPMPYLKPVCRVSVRLDEALGRTVGNSSEGSSSTSEGEQDTENDFVRASREKFSEGSKRTQSDLSFIGRLR